VPKGKLLKKSKDEMSNHSSGSLTVYMENMPYVYMQRVQEHRSPMATRMVLAGLILLVLGGLGTVSSILNQSTILAFVSLTLILWGCLFTLVLPSKYVKSEIMDHMSSSSLSAIDQIIKDLNLKGKPVYIPVPRGLYLPYLRGMKNEFVYIPEKDIEIEAALEQAFTRKPKGLRLTPPGLALADLLETKSRLKFYDLETDTLIELLPTLITREAELAENLEISLKEGRAHTTIKNAACQDLCALASRMENICPYIGCPITSSIACILTRVTNRPIILESCLLRNNMIEAHYQILQ
jgi:hypothetical protein